MRGDTGNGFDEIKKRVDEFEALTGAIDSVLTELSKAVRAHPDWQTDPIHAAAVVAEESGELIQAALDHTYQHCNHKDGDTLERMKKEAIQTGAMALRFLIHLDDYTSSGAVNHEKKGGCHEVDQSDVGFFKD